MDKLVKNKQDILKNFGYFIKNENEELYLELIKHGRNFIPIKKGNKYYFMPSKFAGYINNNFKVHQNRKKQNRDGRDTDKKISVIYKKKPKKNDFLEKHYQKLCKQYNITVYKYKRKYWSS